jgi:S-adenosylmethionine hydrolase
MNPSGIITLTTDFGTTDPYAAMMKGVILSINTAAKIIDVTHQIRAGSVSQAAVVILETFPYFPAGTVHVAVVDPGVGSGRRLIALQARSHWFVGPDNGVFWPVIKDDKGALVVQLTETKYFLAHITRTFHGREIFAPVAAHLSLGVSLEGMGRIVKNPVSLNLPAPYEDNDALYGQVIWIDNFGNIITNISSVALGRFLGKAMPCIKVGNLVIKRLSNIYADVEEGELLALINSSDLLEVAVNMGRACDYLGADPGQIVGTQVMVTKSNGAS